MDLARAQHRADPAPAGPGRSRSGATESAELVASFLHLGEPASRNAVALATRMESGWVELTYAELDRRSAQVRTWLALHGVAPGDRVGLLGESGNDWVAAFFGVLRVGAIAMPLEAQATVEELAHVWRRGATSALLVSRNLVATAEAMLARSGLPVPVLTLEDIATCPDPVGTDAGRPMNSTAVLVWTSGTTGQPKGVCLTFANLTFVVASSAAGQGTTSDDRWLGFLPLHHLLALSCGLLACLWAGATMSFPRSLMPHEIVASMSERRITQMMAVPQMLRLLEPELARRPAAGGTLRAVFCGGAALSREVVGRYAVLGIPVYQGYGLTELAPIVSMNTATDNRPGSVGRPIDGACVRIEEGEILVHSPGLMAGYWNDDALTATVVDADGWFRTGDLGHLDADGYLYVTGRASELIVLASGKNVSPAEVETALADSELLAEVCVVGVRVSEAEQVCAVVVPTPEMLARHADPARLREEVAAEIRRRSGVLSGHKHPTIVKVWTAPLPRTAKRSIRRADVARLAREETRP
jgi:long-chain acyl-CoA synthetase